MAAASPPAIAVRAVFTALRSALRMLRLRRRRFSFWRARFFADLCWATRASLWETAPEHSSATCERHPEARSQQTWSPRAARLEAFREVAGGTIDRERGASPLGSGRRQACGLSLSEVREGVLRRSNRFAAAISIVILGLAAPGMAFEIPAGDTSETELPEVTELGAPEASPAAFPTGPKGARIQRSWLMPASSLESRVTRTRRDALSAGVWNVDAAGRAALRSSEGSSLDRAHAAVALAPNLPTAHMALASARWLEGGDPIAAVWSVVDALAAATRHPEGAVWLVGSGLLVGTLCLLGAGLLTLIGSGLAAFVHVAHDLGHLMARSAPEYARVALLCGLVLVPLAMGEGVFGLALGMLAIAVFYGNARHRFVLALAAILVGVAAYPMAELAGRTLAFFPRDATAAAAYAVAGGSVSPLDIARLQAHREEDDLALFGMALDARQRGSVGQADAYYQQLALSRPDDPTVANNAANVRLDLDHMESAFALYSRALDRSESAVVLFNLSQAYGRGFQVDDLNRTLEHAQAVDGELVARLTSLEGTQTEGFVADLPLPTSMLWRRLWENTQGAELAVELRGPLAPGKLGVDRSLFASAFGVVWLLFAILGAGFESSRGCSRCGTRVCPRCDSANTEAELCTGCTRLFFEPEKTDRALRTERINALARRQRRIDGIVTAVSVFVPGAAGLIARRPLTLLLGMVFCGLAVAGVVWREGVVSDPDVLGSVVPVIFLGMAVLGLAGHAALVASALSARNRRRS